MPLIHPQQKPTKKALETELDGDTHAKLQAYRRYSGASTSEIVAGALNVLFEKDAEFGPWYETHKEELAKHPSGSQSGHPNRPSPEGRKK